MIKNLDNDDNDNDNKQVKSFPSRSNPGERLYQEGASITKPQSGLTASLNSTQLDPISCPVIRRYQCSAGWASASGSSKIDRTRIFCTPRREMRRSYYRRSSAFEAGIPCRDFGS